MKIGAIDIGTNSMRLLTADFENGVLKDRRKYVNTTRIGQGVDENGYITEEAIDRNIKAIKEYRVKCDDYGCERIICMGTSALRDSKNREEFIKRAKDESGIDVNVIPGETEAKLGFKGVLNGSTTEGGILILDIGGGSTEFIFGDRDGIKNSVSINIGALRLTEKFAKTDPVSEENMSEMYEFIEQETKDIVSYLKEQEISELWGIGGTITSMSAINQKLEVYSMEKIHASKISYDEVSDILDMLKKMSHDERVSLNGLQPKRADIITAGVVILFVVMNQLLCREINVSEYDNLEGVIYETAGK